MWYNNKAVAESGAQVSRGRRKRTWGSEDEKLTEEAESELREAGAGLAVMGADKKVHKYFT